MGLVIVGLLLTLPECSKSSCIGLLCWIIVLLGGLMHFGLSAARNVNDEGNKGLYFLILYFVMIVGLRSYFKLEDITFETCQVFPYIFIPQILAGLIITLFDSSHSGSLIVYTFVCCLFGLSVKVSCEMIVENNIKKLYKKGQQIAASQKLFTDLLIVCGECIFEGFEKGAIEEHKDLQVTFE